MNVGLYNGQKKKKKGEKNVTNEESKELYEDLFNAVVVQAVRDYFFYREKKDTYKDERKRREAEQLYTDADNFLHSDTLKLFTDIPVEVLLNEEVKEMMVDGKTYICR